MNTEDQKQTRFEMLSRRETRELVRVRRDGTAIVLYLILKEHAGANGLIRVKQTTLAQQLAEDQKQPVDRGVVNKALARLNRAGLVTTERTGKASRYSLPFHNAPDEAPTPQHEEARTPQQEPGRGDNGSSDEASTPHGSETNREKDTTNKTSPGRAVRIAKYLVDLYLQSRPTWPPKYSTKEVRDRAIRSLQNTIVRGEDPEQIERAVRFYIRTDLATTDYPYKVTNLFGRAERWKEIEADMQTAQRANELRDVSEGGEWNG